MANYRDNFSDDGYRKPDQLVHSTRHKLNLIPRHRYDTERGREVKLERQSTSRFDDPEKLNRFNKTILNKILQTYEDRRSEIESQVQDGAQDRDQLKSYLALAFIPPRISDVLEVFHNPVLYEGKWYLVHKMLAKKKGVPDTNELLIPSYLFDPSLAVVRYRTPHGDLYFVAEKGAAETAVETVMRASYFMPYIQDELDVVADNVGEAIGLQGRDFDPDIFKGRIRLLLSYENERPGDYFKAEEPEEDEEPVWGRRLKRLLEALPEIHIADEQSIQDPRNYMDIEDEISESILNALLMSKARTTLQNSP